MDVRATEKIDQTLAALADPYRRKVVDLLSARPYQAGELARALSVAPPAMSRHLGALKKAGLVEESHPAFDARVRIYALRPQPMVHLVAWLEATERLWSEQLLAFKDHAEKAE